ncbi:MAG: [protein-PII] uridylyltransferase [Verrucomicrobia bacterium]|nr:MAG: [protein-PII] uridylyltransferase [Verrucomicrobiota bacterium]
MRHREKVLAHAEQELFSQGNLRSEELLKLYQKFIKLENHRILLKHRSGGGGREISGQRATVVDIVLRHLLEAARKLEGAPKPSGLKLALVAIGGYGRGELNPYSDVDLMFLHDRSSEPAAAAELAGIVEKILYTLWDVGFKVGHSTRTPEEAVAQANLDMLSKTSLLEARLVAGDEVFFAKFHRQFVKQCVDNHKEEYIAQRVADQTERHAKFGQTVYMQEPNIKNGCGGLRDYQNLLWISFFKEGVRSTAEMVEKKLLNETERRQLDRAYDFLLKIRNELHYLNQRPVDAIVLSQQLVLANNLDYTQKNILRRTEALMRDYYQNARVIYNVTELICERLCVVTPQPNKRAKLLKLLRLARPPKEEHFDGFYSLNGRIYPENRAVFNQNSARLMRLFHYQQKREERVSPELAQLIRRRLHLVDRTFQYSKANREAFWAILSRKGEAGSVLRAMHQVDFLGRYLPEFGELTCLVQHEFFHRYTADEHTLVCIEKLDALLDTEDPKLQGYRKLFHKLEDPAVLYLAILLHDTGKAANVSHHAEASAIAAQRVAVRLQLTSAQRKMLIFLVDHHSTLSSTAQRRNVEDAATIEEFAGLVGSQGNLEALMLLTLVDGQGVGDDSWSDWKESLVWQLYRSTQLFLGDNAEFFRQRRVEREDLRAGVTQLLKGKEMWEGEIAAHFLAMPERYFLTYPAEAMSEHIRLFRRFLEQREQNAALALAPALKWLPHPNRAHTEFWFCGWDRHALLSKIAGSLSAAGFNILSADAFTRADSLVLDIFRVCTRDFEAVTDRAAMDSAEKVLRSALEDESFDFTSKLNRSIGRRGFQLSESIDFPTRIAIDNSTHPIYTVVDIQTADRLGLLHALLKAFGDEGLEIALSRVNTEKGAAIDSFYITDEIGQKVCDSERLTNLQRALSLVTEQAPPVPSGGEAAGGRPAAR